jgi:hypothetical protein
MAHARSHLLTAFIGIVLTSASAVAQPLGTFRWQLLPYCNVVTLNISQQGGIYTLDGTDDRCLAGQVASARGLAFLNPNGTIGFGVTMVQPGATPVHLEATITLPTLNGTWRDSTGASGNFGLTPGGSIGGPPRSVPPSGLPPGSITAIQLASGAVGTPAIAPNAINGAHVLDGSLTMADISDAPRLAFHSPNNLNLSNVTVDTVVAQATVTAPAGGRVLVIASGLAIYDNHASLEGLYCSLTTGTVVSTPFSEVEIVEASTSALSSMTFGAMRVFSVSASSTTTFRLVCKGGGLFSSGTVIIRFPRLTALFMPEP